MKSTETIFKELVIDRININKPLMDSQRYPWCVFWFDEEWNYICHWDYKYEWFFFDYDRVWQPLKLKSSLNYNELRSDIKSMVEKYFNLKGVTVGPGPMVLGVEEYFQKKEQ